MELDLLKVGDKAPNFSLPDHNGDICNLSDYNKKNLIIEAAFIEPPPMPDSKGIFLCIFI